MTCHREPREFDLPARHHRVEDVGDQFHCRVAASLSRGLDRGPNGEVQTEGLQSEQYPLLQVAYVCLGPHPGWRIRSSLDVYLRHKRLAVFHRARPNKAVLSSGIACFIVQQNAAANGCSVIDSIDNRPPSRTQEHAHLPENTDNLDLASVGVTSSNRAAHAKIAL